MSEKVCDGIDRPDSEVEPTRPDDYEAFVRRYLADVASVMYHIVQGDGDASMDVNLARFDSHGNLSEDEFDTYRIEYKASKNGGIGECRVYKIVPGEDDSQEATEQEITAQGANLDMCNTLGRILEKFVLQQEPGGRNDR